MECSCGATLKEKQIVSKKRDLKYVFEECERCGRIGPEWLYNYDGSKLIQAGIKARGMFNALMDEPPKLF